jgi:hypothetical protein
METCFKATQFVEMTVPQEAVPIQHYLRQPRRVVNALAASSQIEYLGDDVFRLKMRPLTFMMLSLQPIVDMKVWAEADGTVHIRSIACEIRGIEYINQRFALNLAGKLQPQTINSVTTLIGKAELEVRVEIPFALMFTPKPLLEASGNGLLKSVLLTIKQRLMHHLLLDYRNWVGSSNAASHAASNVVTGLSGSNPIA